MLHTNTSGQVIKQIDSKQFKKMILAGTCWLNEHKDYVDSLNVFPVPDGDTGSNMYLTVLNAARQVQETESDKVSDIADSLQEGALLGARGNSGVILSQLFRGIAHGLEGEKVLTSSNLAKALQQASEMAYKAVMKPVEGTILTVSRFAGDGAVEMAEETDNVLQVLQAAVNKGQEALDKTPEMLPVLKDAGVVDAGGQGYLFLLEGALRVLKGQPVEGDGEFQVYDGNAVKAEPKEVVDHHPTSAEDIKYPYCTELMINSADVPIDKVRSELEQIGDSLLVVGSKKVTKIHVHTSNPGQVLDYALEFGPITNIKIENMIEQSMERNEKLSQQEAKERKPFGIVSVAAGDGLAEIFESLGVDQLIKGGQSMNPSTQDLVEAVEKVNSDHVIILPNNKNIIFAAEQVKNISDKEVIVVPTRSIPQGIGSLMKLNPDLSFAELAEEMIQGIEEIKTGEITYAVRDSKVNSMEIEEGDCLGLYNGDITVAEKDCEETIMKLLAEMIDEDDFLITLYHGADVSEEDAEDLLEKIEEEFDELDVELYYGGQPLYDYIFSVE